MAAAGAAEPMDSIEMIALAVGGGVILVVVLLVLVLPVLGRSRHGPERVDETSYVTGSGATDGD